MTPLTIACVWVKGQVPFGPEYVIRLDAMTRRFLYRPCEFVCLTDRPWLLPATIRTIPIHLPPKLMGWWAKVNLFNPRLNLQGRVLYLDLDTLLVDALDPVIDFPASFALAPHAGTFNGKGAKAVVKRFNSSVMVWNAGEQSELFTKWTPRVADRLWGDQDWIGLQCPDAAVMPSDWFPRISDIEAGPIPRHAKVVLVKKPKNVEAAERWPWVREAWV